MTPGDVVRARILAIPAVTALVGTRVTMDIFPQKPVWPAVRVTDIGQVEELHLQGAVGVVRGRVQVDVISGKRSGVSARGEARDVMALIHGDFSGGSASGLNGFSGSIGAVVVDVIEPSDYRERYEDEELEIFMTSRDYFATVRN